MYLVVKMDYVLKVKQDMPLVPALGRQEAGRALS